MRVCGVAYTGWWVLLDTRANPTFAIESCRGRNAPSTHPPSRPSRAQAVQVSMARSYRNDTDHTCQLVLRKGLGVSCRKTFPKVETSRHAKPRRRASCARRSHRRLESPSDTSVRSHLSSRVRRTGAPRRMLLGPCISPAAAAAGVVGQAVACQLAPARTPRRPCWPSIP